MEIGFIGLGIMGMPMLERLCADGQRVFFYARKQAVVEAATKIGGKPTATIAQLAGRVDVLILCLYSDQQVRELTLSPGGIAEMLKPGAALVIHTTGSPATARDIAAVLTRRNCHVLDVPVSGGPHNISAGNITLLAGGDTDIVEQYRSLLSAYGDPILHTGPLGSGQAVKLVNNLLFGANVDLVAEASRILIEMNVDPAMALDAISHCSGDSKVVRMALRSGSIDALQNSAGKFIAKDRAVAGEVADELGIKTGLLGRAKPANTAD